MITATKNYVLDYILPPTSVVLIILGVVIGDFFYILIPIGIALIFYSIYR